MRVGVTAGAGRDHLLADDAADALDEVGIPGGGEADRLRELRGVAGAQSGGALLVNDRRDAEPGVLDEVPLDLVGERGAVARPESGGRADPRDLTDAVREPARRGIG